MTKLSIVLFKLCVIMTVLVLATKSSLILANVHPAISIQQSSDINQWHPVSDSILAHSRGGFMLPNGVVIDISFDKRILQNGDEKFHSFFQLPENIALIQDGQLDITSEINEDIMSTVIQNNLDNQTFQSINTINIDIKNVNNAARIFNNNGFFTQFVLPNMNH